MSAAPRRSLRSGAPQSGYALLMAMFIVATMILFAAMATPSVLTQGRREREQEAIWRGNQYVRAIRLYYKNTGRYPQSLEDLSKANAAGVHFLRKAYTDPTNVADGSWRLIYVSPAGQLIGSVRYHSLQEMAIAQGFAGQLPAAVPGLTAAAAAQISSTQAPQSPDGTAAAGQTPSGAPQGQAAPAAAAQGGSFTSSFSSSAQAAPGGNLAPVDGPVLGGSVIGVAGKTKQPSVLVYQGGTSYFNWEFIWNPLTAVSAGGAAAQAPTNGAALPPGGAVPGTPAVPTNFPPETPAPVPNNP